MYISTLQVYADHCQKDDERMGLCSVYISLTCLDPAPAGNGADIVDICSKKQAIRALRALLSCYLVSKNWAIRSPPPPACPGERREGPSDDGVKCRCVFSTPCFPLSIQCSLKHLLDLCQIALIRIESAQVVDGVKCRCGSSTPCFQFSSSAR